jgi:hypothetical protein
MIAEKKTEVNYRVKPVTRLPYPAGIYSASISYTCSANVAPYVVFQPNTSQDAVRYVMNKVGTWLGTEQGMTPAEDYAKNGENATWLPFEHFNAIEIELALIQFAKIGQAIFYDQYMFSQNGFDANGNITSDYKDFTPSMDKFIPMILFDFLKGTGHLGGKSIRFDEYGRIIMKSDMVYEWRIVNNEPVSHVTEYPIDFSKGSLLDVSADAYYRKIDTIVIPPTSDVPDGFQFRIRGRSISRNDSPSAIKSTSSFCAKINDSYQTFTEWGVGLGYVEEYIVSKGDDGSWYIATTREISVY